MVIPFDIRFFWRSPPHFIDRVVLLQRLGTRLWTRRIFFLFAAHRIPRQSIFPTVSSDFFLCVIFGVVRFQQRWLLLLFFASRFFWPPLCFYFFFVSSTASRRGYRLVSGSDQRHGHRCRRHCTVCRPTRRPWNGRRRQHWHWHWHWHGGAGEKGGAGAKAASRQKKTKKNSTKETKMKTRCATSVRADRRVHGGRLFFLRDAGFVELMATACTLWLLNHSYAWHGHRITIPFEYERVCDGRPLSASSSFLVVESRKVGSAVFCSGKW